MKTKSFHCQSTGQLESMLLTSVQDISPTLGIVFCSTKHNVQQIQAIFRGLDIDLIGCTTAGEIVDTALLEDAIAVLLLDIDPAFYQVGTIEHQSDDVYQAAHRLGAAASEQFENPAMLILSGGLIVNAERIISGLQEGARKNLPIYGGLAGDDLSMEKTIAFSHEGGSDNCLTVLAVDTDKVFLKGLAISGWEPVGGVNTITACEENVIYTINGEPAYDVFIRYFGLSEDNDKSDLLITIQTNYPFQILRENGSFVLRSPFLINEEDRSITMSAGVKEGDQFRFSTSPGFEVIEQTVEEFSRLQTTAPEADALILFSCKGRHGAFGPMLEDEIQGIYRQWNKPMVGLLSYGEFGDDGKGSCEFHNATCSLVILKEK